MSHWDVPSGEPLAPKSEQHCGLQGNPPGSAWNKINKNQSTNEM